ncbi:MAG: hypothetical protein Fues2KO_00860 [Fuerstiella sp.]
MPRKRRKVTHSEAYGAVQLEMLIVLQEQATATVDDVRARLDIPDSAVMKIGPAINQLRQDGRIVPVDRMNTGRRRAHGREVKVWRLAD